MSTTPTPLTRVLRWLRGPWVAPDPSPALSWLDRKDGLDTRLNRCRVCKFVISDGVDICADCERLQRQADLHATLRAEGTRYDAELPDVIAAEARPRHADGFIDRNGNPLPIWLGGDLAAMAAPLTDWGVDWRYVDPLPGMARDELGTYAEPVEAMPRHAAEPALAVRHALGSYDEPVKPRGRHRQTDPLDLILADLRDLDGQ